MNFLGPLNFDFCKSKWYFMYKISKSFNWNKFCLKLNWKKLLYRKNFSFKSLIKKFRKILEKKKSKKFKNLNFKKEINSKKIKL